VPSNVIGLRPAYLLVRVTGERGNVSTTHVASLPALAVEVALAVRHAPWGLTFDDVWKRWARERLLVSTPTAKPLNVIELAAWGKRLIRESQPSAPYFLQQMASLRGYERRRGPVPGVHKLHSYRFHRRPATVAERRINQARLDSGEPAARPRRMGANLPSDRDDGHRCIDRSWKAQHKGIKQWDRPRLAG
jgi:hypothetical protein